MIKVKIFKNDILVEEKEVKEKKSNATKHKSEKDNSLQKQDKGTSTETEKA